MLASRDCIWQHWHIVKIGEYEVDLKWLAMIEFVIDRTKAVTKHSLENSVKIL